MRMIELQNATITTVIAKGILSSDRLGGEGAQQADDDGAAVHAFLAKIHHLNIYERNITVLNGLKGLTSR